MLPRNVLHSYIRLEKVDVMFECFVHAEVMNSY